MGNLAGTNDGSGSGNGRKFSDSVADEADEGAVACNTAVKKDDSGSVDRRSSSDSD